jgi:hypothetical protein
MSLQKYVQVELGGKEKLLKFDYNSVSDLEAHYGKGIGAILDEAQFGFHTARMFYTFGLRWKEPGITPQRVGELLGEKINEGATLETIFEPITQALNKSKLLGNIQPEEEEEEGKN